MNNRDSGMGPAIFAVTLIGYAVIFLLVVVFPLGIIYFVGRKVSPKTRIQSGIVATGCAASVIFLTPHILEWTNQPPLHYDYLALFSAIGFLAVFVIDCIYEEPHAFGLAPAVAAPNPASPSPEHQDWNETHQDDGFEFNSSRFKNDGPDSTKEMPYGVDKRHPDDAKFWAYVDDPNASDQERKNAFDKILKAQAKRKGKNTKRNNLLE